MNLSTTINSPTLPGAIVHSQVSRAAAEAQVLERAHRIMDGLKASHPDFFSLIEDSNPMLAERDELVDLMRNAPSSEVYMYLYASFMMRIEIAAITEREFV